MIRYLLGQEYMGLHVGPEPTTDRYVAIVHGDTDDVIQVGWRGVWVGEMLTDCFDPSTVPPSHPPPKKINTITHTTGQGPDGEPLAALQGDGGLCGARRQVPGRGACVVGGRIC